MDRQKYESRILDLAAQSLAIQRVRHLRPVKLKTERGRFFLIECNNGTHLFVRWEDWLWKIEGMTEFPPKHEKHQYSTRNRPKPQNRPRVRPAINIEIMEKLKSLEASIGKRQRPRGNHVVA
jgi:hypothetical protein